MDRIDELVRQLEPESGSPSLEAQARQREALIRSMATGDHVPGPAPHWRRQRGAWLVVLAGAAAVAILVAVLVPRASRPGRSLYPSVKVSAVLASVRRALTAAGDDVEKVQSTLSGGPLSTTSWVDLATGACRVDTSLNGLPTMTIFDEHGRVVVIDYSKKEWWTAGNSGVTCEPLTPPAIEHSLASGRYTVTGRGTIDGQPVLKLVSTTTSSGLHPTTKVITLWVNASTDLPVRSTSTGHLTQETIFTWLPATSGTPAVFNVAVPAGFQQVAAPPARVQLAP